MSKRILTLTDIQRRKAQVLKEIAKTRDDVQNEVCGLTNPNGRDSIFAPLSTMGRVVYVAKKAYLAYKVAYSVVRFFRRRRH